MQVDSMPLTVNGKLDTRALSDIEISKSSKCQRLLPRNELESQLCRIWSELLAIPLEDIEISDDFFQLGGDSITSIQLINLIAAAEAVDGGAGLLFIVKNYEGDIMNFEMAREMAGMTIETVITNDDVAVENSLFTTGRRGVAGTMVVEKVVGAAAEKGADLTALKALGDKVNGATRSMGVALTSCTVPAAGKPTFAIGEDEMEMGVGIHGEPGRRRVKLTQADAIAEEMIGAITGDLAGAKDSPVLLLVNGFGGTPSMELYLMYRAASNALAKRGVRIARSLVGSYVTSLDMAGCSLTVTVLDDETMKLWDAPVHTAGLRWGM
jgi:dihydroxyacetone kinase-like protein